MRDVVGEQAGIVRIARAGWPFILPIAALAVLCGALGAWLLAAPLAVLVGYVTFFFRDPERETPQGERLLVAPADARVMRVLERDDARTELHVFLGLMDVHLNRAPADGSVKSVVLRGEAHVLAWKDEAVERNVQNRVVFETASGEIEMRQIVGFAARRLEFWKAPGDEVKAGERVGIMKFGSRIDLVLPPGTQVDARPGDRIVGGVTIIGRLPAARTS